MPVYALNGKELKNSNTYPDYKPWGIGIKALPQLKCRKCEACNPMVYFAPVIYDNKGSCICFDCAKLRNWLTKDGDLKLGIGL